MLTMLSKIELLLVEYNKRCGHVLQVWKDLRCVPMPGTVRICNPCGLSQRGASNKYLKCSACKMSWYCSKECQLKGILYVRLSSSWLQFEIGMCRILDGNCVTGEYWPVLGCRLGLLNARAVANPLCIAAALKSAINHFLLMAVALI